jgi:hypothetical protein
MSEDSILKCLVAFVLGFLVARMMRGNGLSVGGRNNRLTDQSCKNDDDECQDISCNDGWEKVQTCQRPCVNNKCMCSCENLY